MDFGVALGTYTGGREAGPVDIVEVAFGELRLSRFFRAVDFFPGGGRGEREFIWGDTKDGAWVVDFVLRLSFRYRWPHGGGEAGAKDGERERERETSC